MAAFAPIASLPIAATIGGVGLNASISEAGVSVDAQTAVLTAVGAIAETLTATDAADTREIIAETLSATDAVVAGLIRVGVLTEAAGARESVLNASYVSVTAMILEAATASDVVRLPVWTDNADDDQTWLPNTNADSVWADNAHVESTWTEN
jgi:hypothetical protein